MPKKTYKKKIKRFHTLTIISGKPKIGRGTYIGAFSEVNSKNAKVEIGKNCDIASFVSINAADSHKRCIGKIKKIERKNIKIGDNVFIGSHSVVLGGANIGHNCVIAAGSVVRKCNAPSFSLIIGNPAKVKKRFYKK